MEINWATKKYEESNEMLWFYIGMGVGFAARFWVVSEQL